MQEELKKQIFLINQKLKRKYKANPKMHLINIEFQDSNIQNKVKKLIYS